METRHIQFIFWLYELPKSAEPNVVDLTVFMLKDEIGAGFKMDIHPNHPVDGDNSIEICKEHNDKEVIALFQMRQQIESILNRRKHSSKLTGQLSMIDDILVFFEKWYNKAGIPFYEGGIIHEKPLPLYKQFEELFNQLYHNSQTTQEEVKAKLYNNHLFSNPSKYLHDAKKKYGISTSALKQHPGFSWIDPHNTSID